MSLSDDLENYKNEPIPESTNSPATPNMIDSENSFMQSYSDFVYMSDILMTGNFLGWRIVQYGYHTCGSQDAWIAQTLDGTYVLAACVQCGTPRLIFTNN
jgi:hypothetical protein